MKDLVSQIEAWENGDMSEEDELAFFQGLVNSGLAWQLQGAYGRHAVRLIKAGLIQAPSNPVAVMRQHVSGKVQSGNVSPITEEK